ncbi:lipase 3 [Orussus abietinus]|uniref:lipase 3 n=1 Tax=Orussus abietinus TaxID=222816 RepID=UPI0006259687|nr:lipase 3 [Orussus abietinus]
MSIAAFAVLLLTISNVVVDAGIIQSLLFPKNPKVVKVRDPQTARALGKEPFVVLDFVGLVEQHGYPAESHNIVTEDGYILTFHRIPGTPESPDPKGKRVVFIQHGILASSDTWVLFGPGKDLAFLLAEAGYDVWVGNIRGNTYGRKHVNISTNDPKFWEFSYHEMAMFDIPGMIDHILEVTGEKTLTYIGHSMGTTISYSMLSRKPEYNEKIHLVISLAPVAYWVGPLPPWLKLVMENWSEIQAFFLGNGIYDIAPQTTTMAVLGRALCGDYSPTQPVCVSVIFVLSGIDENQLDTSVISHISAYYPAGASFMSFKHYVQNIQTVAFRAFDFGKEENRFRYHQEKPPEYDLSRVTAPVALIFGPNDNLVQKSDVEALSRNLSNVVTVEPVPYKKFTHVDFLWAKDAKSLVYDRVIELIKQYQTRR